MNNFSSGETTFAVIILIASIVIGTIVARIWLRNERKEKEREEALEDQEKKQREGEYFRKWGVTSVTSNMNEIHKSH